MRSSTTVDRYRLEDNPEMGFDPSFGMNGCFIIKPLSRKLVVIASDQMGWEHVSVSVRDHPDRIPSWEEMCAVKEMFWEDDEVVMQLHPTKEDWIDCHPGCLHLWRPLEAEIPLPPKIMVAPAW